MSLSALQEQKERLQKEFEEMRSKSTASIAVYELQIASLSTEMDELNQQHMNAIASLNDQHHIALSKMQASAKQTELQHEQRERELVQRTNTQREEMMSLSDGLRDNVSKLEVQIREKESQITALISEAEQSKLQAEETVTALTAKAAIDASQLTSQIEFTQNVQQQLHEEV